MKTRRLATRILFSVIALCLALAVIPGFKNEHEKNVEENNRVTGDGVREINGAIEKGETFFDIFRKFRIDMADFIELRQAAADIHRLRDIEPGQPYKIILDDNNRVDSLNYWIDRDSMIRITRTETGFAAKKICNDYERRVVCIGGIIQDSLVSSMGQGRENLMLALELSDIFAWDLDFTSDLRQGDTFRLVVEGYYLDGEFTKYGNILAAQFINMGEKYEAYRFGEGDKIGYYDGHGKSLRKAFLRAPLNFRRISSFFAGKRYHPILKVYRPHHGLDYAAPKGTPVCSVGDGVVKFCGVKGQYGKLVVLRHKKGQETRYGHLSRIVGGLKRGKKVRQGEVVGFVGSTGLATGPHLHYEMRINAEPVNPLKIKTIRYQSIMKADIGEFRRYRDRMLTLIDSTKIPSYFCLADQEPGT